MKKAVLFFLIIAPVFYSGILAVTDIREQQFWVLLIGAALFLGLNHYNRIVGHGIIYCLLHLALFQRPNYINNMGQILAHLIVYDCTAKYYKGGNEYRWPILFVMALNLVMVGLQLAHQDVFLQLDKAVGSYVNPGLFTLPVFLGLYAVITAPILCTIHPALIVLSIAGLIVSRSSFAALAFLVSMTFYLWLTRSRILKYWIIASLIGSIWFIGFYDGPTGQFSRRLHIWRQAGSVIAVNPWGGWGLGSYDHYIRFAEISDQKYVTYKPSDPKQVEAFGNEIAKVSIRKWGEETTKELYKLNGLNEAIEWFRKKGSDIYIWNDPHNGYLLAWFELGFPMLILIFWYIYDMGRRFRRSANRYFVDAGNIAVVYKPEIVALFSAFIAVVIVSGAHFAIQIPRLSFTIMILLGILDRRLNER